MSVVYCAKNKINGHFYIGMTGRSVNYRRINHNYCAKSGRGSLVIHRAIRKYGKDAFEWSVLAVCETYADALATERRLIAEMRPHYNSAAGGRGPTGIKWSTDRYAIMSRKLKEAWTKERKVAFSALFTGRPLTDEWKAKVKAAYRPEVHFKPIVCLTDGRWFASVKEAAAQYGVLPSLISHVLNGDQAVTGGRAFCEASQPMTEEERLARLALVEQRRERERARRRLGVPHRRRAVICLTNGQKFETVCAAASFAKVTSMAIVNQCKKERGQTRTGLQFRYADVR